MRDRLYADSRFYARVQKIKLALIAVLLVLAWAAGAFGTERRELRVDTFDARGNRTGYAIVNPQTGRVDTFDARSNRTGHGTITPAPAPRPTSGPPASQSPWSPKR